MHCIVLGVTESDMTERRSHSLSSFIKRVALKIPVCVCVSVCLFIYLCMCISAAFILSFAY